MMRRWVLIGTLWLLSLVAAGTLGYAQVRRDGSNIISGPDLGFVVEEQKNGVAYGQLMVRVKGQWVAAGISSKGGLVPAK
jgi:hypothetical protein